MHEMSIAEALFETAMEEAKRANFSRVTTIKVQIGEMVAVVPSALKFCFNIISQNTIMEGANLEIEIVPIVAQCKTCSILFEVENFSFKCPECGKISDDYISGRELLLTNITGTREGE